MNDNIPSEFKAGFFVERDTAWIETFHRVQKEHEIDVKAWADAFLDFHPVAHQRTPEAIKAWSDLLPWSPDYEGEEQARMAVRMSITMQMEYGRDRFYKFKKEYNDVYKPDEGAGARGLEFSSGWLEIVSDFCEQLRQWRRDGWDINLRWGKEEYGSLRLFTDVSDFTVTPLQSYGIALICEWARRKSLRTCQECGQPGRLRWGEHVATLCDQHAHLVGELRPEYANVLDPDRMDAQNEPTWTDAELGLDEGVTMDLARSLEIVFRPFLSPDLRLPDDEIALVYLKRKMLAVDQAIGPHHSVKFSLRRRGYEIAFDNHHPLSTIDEIHRERIVDEIGMIMRGEQV